jgi:hypothetical protein
MPTLVFVFGLPACCAAAWIILLMRRQGRAVAVSVLTCAVTLAVGYWAIRQSRSSTASLGFLFLPNAAAMSGVLALLFARLRLASPPALRWFAWLFLVGALGLPALTGVGGMKERIRNRERDRKWVEEGRRIEENRTKIAALVQQNGERAGLVLNNEIEKHRSDRTFLIPALEASVVPEDTLATMSRSGDLGVVLAVARNGRTPPKTLDWIYRSSTYPPYFYEALAANKNTPPAILRMLANQSALEAKTMDRALASNPSLPRDILDRISGEGDAYALRNLLSNPALDCGMLRKAAARLGPAEREEIGLSGAAIAALEVQLCQAK